MSLVIHQTVQPDYGLRALIVGDSDAIIDISSTIINRFGYNAEPVDTAQQAVERCRNTSFDVILMDMDMPEINGLAAAKAIRALRGGSFKAYIVVISNANLTHEKLAKCLESGINDCLITPVSDKTLQQRMALWHRLNKVGALYNS